MAQLELYVKRDMSSQGVLKFQFWVGGEVRARVVERVRAKVGEKFVGEVGSGVGD